MIDIDRTLRLLGVAAESDFVQAEAIDAINYLREENARLREALKLCDEAMAWCLGGEPIDTLMIEARRVASAAIREGEKEDGKNN